MSRPAKVIPIVREILERDERARNSDSFLYLKVIEVIAERKHHLHPSQVSVADFLSHVTEWGYPTFACVGRTRRQLQRQYPDLRANEKVQQARAEEEVIYYNFSKTEV